MATKTAKKSAKSTKAKSAKSAKAAKPRTRKAAAPQEPPVEPALEQEIHADHHDGHGHEGHGEAHGHDGHDHDGHDHEGHHHDGHDHAHGHGEQAEEHAPAQEDDGEDVPAPAANDEVAAIEALADEGLEEATQAKLPDDDWAAKLTAARSKPVQLEDETPEPITRRGRAAPVEADDVGAVTMQEEPAAAPARAQPKAAYKPQGWDNMSLPEQFLLVVLGPGWDDRTERSRPGAQGAAIVGSLLLDLAVRGVLKVRQDRFEVTDAPTGDADLDAVAQRVRQLGGQPSAEVMRRLGQRLTDRIRPWKQRLERKGLVEERRRKHLFIFPRSDTYLLDEDAQVTLQNRLMRTLAGSGTPDGQVIALLGLLDASGALPNMVPASALEFNRKRIRYLLTGRDPMGYAVDANMRSNVQEACLQTILRNVRAVQGT